MAQRSLARSRVKARPRILFYHVSGMFFGGTEKYLQTLARNVDPSRYEAFFLYSPKPRNDDYGDAPWNQRLSYLAGSSVRIMTFDYDRYDPEPPHVVHGMSPTIADAIDLYGIDLVVTSIAAPAEFPLSVIRDRPIIVLNVFGTGYHQANIARHLCLSDEVRELACRFVPAERVTTMYQQIEPPPADAPVRGAALRSQLGIPEDAIVFGRIGRATDDIYDPIAIEAFATVVAERPWIHYLVKSPMPAIRTFVEVHDVPNVHFLPPSAIEAEVWAFHNAYDAMAHFRRDGECGGTSIQEAMISGRPVITHRSRQWNGHLEFVRDGAGFVASIDDVPAYADALRTLADDRAKRRISGMGEIARSIAEPRCSIQHNIRRFEGFVEEALRG